MTDDLAEIRVITDGGPWAFHNYPCPVHWKKHAVLNIGTGVFQPSWEAQKDGWMLVRASGWRAWLIKLLGSDGQ